MPSLRVATAPPVFRGYFSKGPQTRSSPLPPGRTQKPTMCRRRPGRGEHGGGPLDPEEKGRHAETRASRTPLPANRSSGVFRPPRMSLPPLPSGEVPSRRRWRGPSPREGPSRGEALLAHRGQAGRPEGPGPRGAAITFFSIMSYYILLYYIILCNII